MKKLIVGIVIGLIVGGVTGVSAAKPWKVMKGWTIAVVMADGTGIACNDPTLVDESKAVACTGGYSIDKYVPGWNKRDDQAR